MKKMMSFLLAMMMVGLLTACGSSGASSSTSSEAESTEAESTEAEATETDESSEASGGTIVMATNAEFPPYEFHEGDEIVGIDAELAAAIAEKLGMELKIEDIAFDSIIPAVTSGKADFGMAGMTVTDERKEMVDFSDTYYTARQVIIVQEGSEIAGPDDLEGKKIGVQQGTTGDLFASDDYGDENIERFNKGFEAVQALSQGKVDAVIIDDQPAQAFVKDAEGLAILEAEYVEEEYAMCFAKDSELVEKCNAALAELKEDGTFDSIIEKYINAD